jgi:hypothetical protein
LLSKEPYLFSIGFLNWSPHSHVDPQPFAVAGYYSDRHEFVAGATHADFRNEALLGYAYDFNGTWRLQVDWQSGSGNTSTIGIVWNITRDFQVNSTIYVTNVARTKCSVTCRSPTHFTSGATENKTA